MKTIAHVICAVILASTLTAHGQTQYAGTTFEVDITRNNGRDTTGVCINFDQNGRFTMSDETLTMLWAPRDQFPNQFMAVTAPGERTVVPHHLAVHGKLQPDKTLTGRGIDQAGNTFVFRGQENNDCGGDLFERAASVPIQDITDPMRPRDEQIPITHPCSQMPCDPIPYLLRAGNSHEQALVSTYAPCSQAHCDPIPNPLRARNPHEQDFTSTYNPCSQAHCDPVPNPLRAGNPHEQDFTSTYNPCSQAHCDPIPNPLQVGTKTLTTLSLAGRSFRLTLGSSDQKVLEYCWTFEEKHDIKAAQSEVLQWSTIISAYNVVGFQSVGAGKNGRGLAYHGTLVGYDLLEVVGIEARDGESVATYGYGQQVSSCK